MTEIDRWWEPRKDGEPTAEFLGRVLDQLGATELASNARACHYDDYRCPEHIDDGMNLNRLVRDIADWAQATAQTVENQSRAAWVTRAVMHGDFDGTSEESLAWARSAEGQSVYAEFMRQSGGPK